MANASTFTGRCASVCRNVALALLSGPLTGRSYSTLERWLLQRPPAIQGAIVGGVLAALLAFALLAAQFGPVGLAVYGIAVVLLAR